MKQSILVFIAAVLILSACASPGASGTPAATQPGVTGQPETTSTVGAVATTAPTAGSTGQSLSDSLQDATPTGGKGLPGAQPEIRWDTRPEAVVISATNCCGFVPQFVAINYIPEAQVWGDGRVVWTQFGEDNQRQVLEGQLTQEQIAALLSQAAEAGFFGWDELYTSPTAPTDMPTKCIYIQLESATRKVCEYYEGAPTAFHDLYNELDGGLSLAGQPYQPQRAYLVAYPIEGSGQEALPQWQDKQVALAQAVNGAWIEGEDLEAAWLLVNQQPFGAAIQEGDTAYRLSLQIPGISFTAPPEP